MSREYVIMTDKTHDMPEGYVEQFGVQTVPILYIVDGETYGREKEMEIGEFYQRMREGATTQTAAPNMDELMELFEGALKQGKDVLFTCLSSGISSTYEYACAAREELKEQYPEQDICVFDSLCACGGQGLLIYHAIENQKKGLSARENMEALEKIKLNVVHKFTVDDLNYLQRGGRISKAAAVVGSMINLKPVLHVDNEGKLVAEVKVRGRKKALNQLVIGMDNCVGSYADKQEAVVICHSDCLEDAEYIKKIVEEKYHPEKIFISNISQTIGAHTGPGTMTLFFMGDVR